MNTEHEISTRADNQCELCKSTNDLQIYAVPGGNGSTEHCAYLCRHCVSQIDSDDGLDVNHWRCLNDSMWSTVPAVQVLAWRQLRVLAEQGETWAQDLQDMMYLDEELSVWADHVDRENEDDATAPTLDSNGTQLQAGDSVYLIKDLDVKGAGFTAKRGTTVRNIALTNNPDHIEGRVNGVRIVLRTEFLKKS